MNSDFWIKKWEDGDIRFHQTKYHPALEKYAGHFSPGTVLVPLCGKSLDMVYLSSMGQSVIGVELSAIACRSFFEENRLRFTEESTKDFLLFKSDRITLWCGDFFKLPQQVWDVISGIYDRAALIALPEEIRRTYAAEIVRRSKKHVGILLISFEYPEGSLEGPPFSVSAQEIRNLYGRFEIQCLHSEKEEGQFQVDSKMKLIELTQTAYWLK